MALDVAAVRRQFPALSRTVGGRPAAYLDGPGGTQVPQSVIDAISAVLARGVSNHGGSFATSEYSGELTDAARGAVADLVGGHPSEVAFGQNMTSITLAVSRALARTWAPGDEIVVTRLDHDANVWPWVIAAEEAGAEVRFADIDPADGCRVRPDHIAAVLSDRTRLVAVTHASNAVGTVVDVAAIASLARAVGSLTFVDAVHVSPHRGIDVQALGCDFLVASAYKFFGPHTGALWGRRAVLESVDAVKIRPAPSSGPGKWETGTQSFESLAGVTAAIDYLASLGSGTDRRSRLISAMAAVESYEATLSDRFLRGIGESPGITLYGIDRSEGRTPTFAIAIDGMSPKEASDRLGEVGIFTWPGHYYAIEPMRRLGVLDEGGLLRVGFVHYSTAEEVDCVVEALDRLASGRPLDDLPLPG